jgi:tripartite-type tricarboxylate transporter receptor subunit TctC
MTSRRTLLAAALAVPPLAAPALREAMAQAPWPERPVRFIVGFAPGGPADIIGRFLAEALTEAWRVPVVVENRGGAGGSIAAQQVQRMAADGYTALVTTSAFAVNPGLQRNPGYRAEDYACATVVAGTPNLIVVRADSPARTLADLIEIGRRRPLNFGSGGIGTTGHLTIENLLRNIAKVDAQHIPFAGGGPAMTALASGQIDLVSTALPGAVGMAQGGVVRGLAVTSARRVASLPDVPTLSEAGFDHVPDLAWVGVFFPAATPSAVLDRVNADTNRVLSQPAFRARIAAAGFEPIGGGVAESQAFVAAELRRWAEVIRALNINPD